MAYISFNIYKVTWFLAGHTYISGTYFINQAAAFPLHSKCPCPEWDLDLGPLVAAVFEHCWWLRLLGYQSRIVTKFLAACFMLLKLCSRNFATNIFLLDFNPSLTSGTGLVTSLVQIWSLTFFDTGHVTWPTLIAHLELICFIISVALFDWFATPRRNQRNDGQINRWL